MISFVASTIRLQGETSMHEAIARMLSKYEYQGLNDYINGLREILQEVALLGLWRSKFLEKAAFYG